MIKRYIPEFACVLLIILTAILLAGRPMMSPRNPQTSRPLSKAPPAATQKEWNGFERPIEPDQAIKERNLFAAAAVPVASKEPPMPENNPYNLIAVLHGKERKAVFRDYLGKVSTYSAGKEMMDKFLIKQIDALSVQLVRGNEKKELRLFNAGGGYLPPAPDNKGGVPMIQKNLYTLTGILGGNEKKAVFRDFNGNQSILGVGAKLNDGAVITRVGDFSVQLTKEKIKSELRVFDPHNTEQSIRKKND